MRQRVAGTKQFETPDGFTMRRPEECRISERFARAVYEADLVLRVDEMASSRPGCIVDGGAHIGHHTLRWTAEGHTVHAFEPCTRLRHLLKENWELNADLCSEGMLHLHSCALGAERAPGFWFQPEADNTADTRVSQNPSKGSRPPGLSRCIIWPLDDRMLERNEPVAVIKLDVEGMEMEALAGARGILDRDRPSLFIECGKTDLQEVLDFLEPWEYTAVQEFAKTPTWHLESNDR